MVSLAAVVSKLAASLGASVSHAFRAVQVASAQLAGLPSLALQQLHSLGASVCPSLRPLGPVLGVVLQVIGLAGLVLVL